MTIKKVITTIATFTSISLSGLIAAAADQSPSLVADADGKMDSFIAQRMDEH